MNIAIRVDASTQMGTGHLMRCLTLGNELRRRGATVRFICRLYPGHLIERIQGEGYEVAMLSAPSKQSLAKPDNYPAWLGVPQAQDAEETLAVLGGTFPDWLVVDHYSLDADWEQSVRSRVKRLWVIDDLANRPHNCDGLLDQNFYGEHTQNRYQGLVPEHCRCFLGPKFALLQPEYAQFRAVLPPRDGIVRRVLVFFGGSDVTNQTKKALTALSAPELTHLAVDVVLGVNHPDPEGIAALVHARPGTTLHQGLPTLLGLMVRADLAIGAGGITTWERCCLGLPTIVVSIADNQFISCKSLAEEKSIVYLGNFEKVNTDAIWRGVLSLSQDSVSLIEISRRSQRFVDGLGVKRLVEALK